MFTAPRTLRFLILLLAAATLWPTLPAFADDDADEWLPRSFHHDRTVSSSRRERSQRSERTATVTPSNAKRARTARLARNEESDDENRGSSRRRDVRHANARREQGGGGGQFGVASYYWEPQALASGGRFNPNAMTAAHKWLPFGTRVRVTRVDNGNSVEVVINDRGPYVGGRIIDLSRRAAQSLSMTGAGVARVRVAVLGRG